MTKIVIVAVFIFWVAVAFFYANTLVQDSFGGGGANLAKQNQNNQQGTKTELANQLVNHNSSEDCWLLIDGKIYDVTSYIYSHPGGAKEILDYCGQDASKAFSSKGKLIPQDHSQAAHDILASYYIGDAYDYNTQVDSNSLNNDQNTNTDSTQNQAPNQPNPVNYTLTTALVAQHNIPSDCWVTANNNVYNVTSYIYAHPGGAGNITAYCGGDIAAAFASQGHSNNAVNIMASYKIGVLGGSVDNSTVESVNNNPINSGNNDDDDDDDDEWDD